jgi:hypothetical protein
MTAISSPRDRLLTKTTDECKIELTERELSRVAGGEYLKIEGAAAIHIDSLKYLGKF